MIEIEDIAYNEPFDNTSFKCTFTKSGYKITFPSALPGELTEAQIVTDMQDEYNNWIERNNIP